MNGVRSLSMGLLATALLACGDGPSPSSSSPSGVNDPAPAATGLPLLGSLGGGDDDPACGTYSDGSAGFAACELKNFARVSEAAREEATNPVFLQRLQAQSLANLQAYLSRIASDPSYLPVGAGGIPLNTPVTPLCASWSIQCAGDPFRYPGVDPFYEREAVVEPVTYYDRECARISGRVWRPKNSTGPLPTVVIENGSVQAPEPLYWWMAQALVRSGYAVMTFDPRGQGRSDQQTPTGGQGSNANSAVFWEGLVDAIDFFRSTPAKPYPHNTSCAGTYPTVVTAFNPQHGVQDRERLGIVGHSLGATGVSVVQSYGAAGAEPWPGKIDASNPVDVAVGWDGLRAPGEDSSGGLTSLTGLLGQGGEMPKVVARVPSMGQNSEYGLAPAPKFQTPSKDEKLAPFKAWQAAGVPVFEFTIRGSSHFEWSLIPTFPATSWCPEVKDGRCVGGWGRPMAEHYTLAWLDRWLKRDGEMGFADADNRLLADAQFLPRFSFYYQSARDFPTRKGASAKCADILAGCATP